MDVQFLARSLLSILVQSFNFSFAGTAGLDATANRCSLLFNFDARARNFGIGNHQKFHGPLR